MSNEPKILNKPKNSNVTFIGKYGQPIDKTISTEFCNQYDGYDYDVSDFEEDELQKSEPKPVKGLKPGDPHPTKSDFVMGMKGRFVKIGGVAHKKILSSLQGK